MTGVQTCALPIWKAAGSLLESIALKLEVPVAKLLERLGVVSPRVVVNTLDDAKSIVSSTATQAGRVGKDFKVASEEELNALYQSLTKNAVGTETFTLKTGGTGVAKILQDGTRVILKDTSATGGKSIQIQTASRNVNTNIHILP